MSQGHPRPSASTPMGGEGGWSTGQIPVAKPAIAEAATFYHFDIANANPLRTGMMA